MGFGSFFKGLANVATGGAYNQIGALTGAWDPASGWSNDWLDTVTPGAGRLTQALTDWQDTGDWAETLNTLTDAPFGGVTGVSNFLGEYTVPDEVRGAAPAIGGAIGSYAVGPIGGAIGAGIGSDIAGGSAKDKYKAAGAGFLSSYAAQGLSGGGWDMTNIPAYDTSGIYSGDYATGAVDSGYYDASSGVGTGAAGGGEASFSPWLDYSQTGTGEQPFAPRTDLAPAGYDYGNTSGGPFTTRADLAPAGYEGMAAGAASGPFATRSDLSLDYPIYEPQGTMLEPNANIYDLYNWGGPGSGYSSPYVGAGGGGGKGGLTSLYKSPMTWLMAAGLVSDTISQHKLRKQQEEAARQYLEAYNKAREEGTWNDKTRGEYMKGVQGTISDYVSGLKRRVGSNAAALGRGGGFYSRNIKAADEYGREQYAKELAKTYEPKYIPPADYRAYLANQGGDWYDSVLSGVGSTAGKMGTYMALNKLLSLS